MGAQIVVDGSSGAVVARGADHRDCDTAPVCKPRPATITLSGATEHVYDVHVPRNVTVSGLRSGAKLTIDQIAPESRNPAPGPETGRLDSNGRDLFAIGGRIQAPAGATPDSYLGELRVTVFYY